MGDDIQEWLIEGAAIPKGSITSMPPKIYNYTSPWDGANLKIPSARERDFTEFRRIFKRLFDHSENDTLIHTVTPTISRMMKEIDDLEKAIQMEEILNGN